MIYLQTYKRTQPHQIWGWSIAYIETVIEIHSSKEDKWMSGEEAMKGLG